MSKQECNYPQKLVLKIHHNDKTRVIQKVEILCHECKISEKIEISLGDRGDQVQIPDSIDQCESITRLGYITMDPNNRSGFQARELKSVPIEKHADFIRLDLQECHTNSHNPGKFISVKNHMHAQ